MWVQEIEFDSDSGTCLNEGDVNNVGDASLDELFEAAKSEYGEPFEMISDPSDTSKNIGWKFKSTASYDDIEDPQEASFTLETWIIIHEKPPEILYFYASLPGLGQDEKTPETDFKDDVLDLD